MRRRAAALVMVAALVSGCGGSSDAPDASADSSSAGASSTPTDVPAADLTQTDLVPPGFPLDQIPTVDGKVISALDTYVAINTDLERAAAFAEAVSRMEAAGYVVEQMEEIDAEARFTGRGLTIDLLVVADGPVSSGVTYSVL